MENYFKYWGKAAEDKNSGEIKYHLLVYHSLDVAAVGKILANRMGITRNIAARLGLKEKNTLEFIGFLCAIHDVGKFSNEFQGQLPNLVQTLRGISLRVAYQEKHWSSGYRFICENADKIFSGDKDSILDVLDSWFSASAGHHGRPPEIRTGSSPMHIQFPGLVARDTIEFITEAKNIFGVLDEKLSLFDDEFLMKEISWQIAGLMVLADWIGSNTRWFPFCNTEQPLKEYWESRAMSQAERAVVESGVLPVTTATKQNIEQLFSHKRITPLQELTEVFPLSNQANFFIIEEITGAGKTEAALMLAHRLITSGHADGFYFGVPTMATANAMHERIEKMYCKLYANGTDPALILAHSASRQYLKLEQNEDDDIDDENGSIDAKVWLYDNRKKSLLAHVGVGTIDQALLAVLPARHQSLRLLGLHRKVLIVDEVHAYDSYMNKLLCTLLKYHAAQGGSAVLLSATLPMKQRKDFLAAFAEGRKIGFDRQVVLSSDYPLVSGIMGKKFIEKSVGSPEHLSREVLVKPVYDESDILEYVRIAVQSGRNVCWIRNTVFDAQNAFEALSEKWGSKNITLFHARFTLGDRLLIEKDIVASFGEKSGAETRKGKIVIATQVVEQSLDIDFDCMITDLVPIDLIIQRAGRLCRHARDEQGNRITIKDKRGVPELMVHMPLLNGEITAEWYKKKFPKVAGVYEHHGQLWLTARWLVDNKRFRMPQDARTMIEYVYGESTQSAIPAVLERQENIAGGGDRARAGVAQFQELNLESGYMPGPNWTDDEKAPTRLSDPRTTVRLARWEHEALVPFFDDGWLLSEVSVLRYLIKTEDEVNRKEIDVAKSRMPDKGKFCVVIPLIEKDGIFIGTALNQEREKVTILYDRRRGLRVQGQGESNEPD